MKQTNIYCSQSQKPFEPTTREEMLGFLAINIMMEIKKLPCIRDYWSSNSQLRDTYISSVMSLNRFFFLLSKMHLNDNSLMPKKGYPNYDKLYKIAPMINQLSENFLKSYNPIKEQAVDESMIKFKGRSTLKQYHPQKPIKRGHKVWVRADLNVFVCQFEIYTGKINGRPEKLLGERVVRNLSRNLAFKFYHLYFDNYFTSVSLMISLKQDGILACGTVRSNRKDLPKMQKTDKSMNKGESEFRSSFKGIDWVKWFDNKHVVNSFIIYKQRNTDSQMTLKDFRLLVIDQLIGYYSSNKRGKKRMPISKSNFKKQVSNERRFSQAPHLPIVLDS